ncbi:hypothetical protein M2T82_02795 [Elizabethkingia ursingii]|uniref:hypothetical protein n=1 Tax=Elizabethkingia ursingii TaxID=1756150 RepID=UPI002013B537|nr:hypothetical protein [Elizabethkingia ursingii]MCL1666984.1 hypothetical protein [Elizabethkingia ursingii]
MITFNCNSRKIIERSTYLFLSFYFFNINFAQKTNKQFSSIDIFGTKGSVSIYEISSNSDLIQNKILRLEVLNRVSPINGKNQKTIFYDYCNSIEECQRNFKELINGNITESHDEITGIDKGNNYVWIHPPRSDNFKILELNAFPYFVKNEKKWENSITFNDSWGNKNWIEWEGYRTANSTYELTKDNILYSFQGKDILCSEISAFTSIPGLGKTNANFYYNSTYGFVRMTFTTINNKIIELKLLKTLNDSNN